MKPTRLALAQTYWPGNREQAIDVYSLLVADAARAGVQLISLPEFTLSPYFAGTRDKAGFAWAENLLGGPSDEVFSALAAQFGVMIVASIFEQDDTGLYWDTATVHDTTGRLAHFTRKVHIPSGDAYHETDFFGGADAYPVHDLGSVKLAAPTCYDQWFPEVARIYALSGAELIAYPTAIGSEPNAPDFDSKAAWQTIMRGHAVANGLFIGAANRTGTEGRVTFYGSSFICDPGGAILAEASRTETDLIVADLDPQTLTLWRDLFPLLHQRRPATYGRLVDPADPAVERPDWLGK
jgi:N-carbamoylputrescine amidase